MLPKISYKIVFNFLFEILKNNGGIRGKILNEVIQEKINSEGRFLRFEKSHITLNICPWY